jgi:two-component system, OmpR family, sensor histidine kinase KdpD
VDESSGRPDPAELLARIDREKAESSRPLLRIFLGMSAGVGKTYAMIQEARAAAARGVDIAIAAIETHGRAETEALLEGLERMPPRRAEYRGMVLEELDLDAVIARAPEVAVVDELAHENSPGSRHVKRWQDVEELLEKGVSVWTAVNIQHVESYSDVVEELTFARVRERVPDTVMDRADEIRLIDIAPEALIRRLEEGLVYAGASTRSALENFFTPVNLGALREIALRYATRAASRRLTDYARSGGAYPSESSLGERILVAVGPSPSSAYLVRWARRTAYALRADWTAVNVQTGAPTSPEEQGRIESNLELARKLGAEVVVARSPDVAGAVVDLARSRKVSMIIVGRSGLTLMSGLARPGILRRASTVSDRIVRMAAPIDIALVQDSASPPSDRPLERLRRLILAPARQYAFLAAAFAFMVLLGELAAPYLGYRGIAMAFLAAVLGLSTVAAPVPVAAFAAFSALALNYFFIPPLHTFTIQRLEDWVLFGVYFLVAFMTSGLVSRLRSRENLLRDREEAATFLARASSALSDSRSVDEACAAAALLARERFRSEAVALADDGAGGLSRLPAEAGRPELGERELDVARYAFAERSVCGRGTDTLPEARLRWFPAVAGDRPPAGVIGVGPPPEAAWTRSDDGLIASLGRTLALSVERLRAEAASREALLRLESERLGGILLDSVSHELRTPLTAITGALSALRDDSLAARADARAALLATALEASDALDDIVEDILSISRIESGMLRVARKTVDLGDLARAAISRAGPEVASRRIETSAPADSEGAFVDAALAARLAANLLRNAVRYSPEGAAVDFALEPRPGSLSIRVRDRGPGIPEDELATAFSRFARGRGAKGKGLGLGLAICRGIAEAHGGSIRARNAEGGGLEVEASLPYGEEAVR